MRIITGSRMGEALYRSSVVCLYDLSQEVACSLAYHTWMYLVLLLSYTLTIDPAVPTLLPYEYRIERRAANSGIWV